MYQRTQNTEQYHRLLAASDPKMESLKLYDEAKSILEKVTAMAAWNLYVENFLK